jgi:hypothetical protein
MASDVYDQYLINILYDPRIRPGMTKGEVDALLPDISRMAGLGAHATPAKAKARDGLTLTSVTAPRRARRLPSIHNIRNRNGVADPLLPGFQVSASASSISPKTKRIQ